MCMGMMNYRKSKSNLTVITCKRCGRAWQVTEIEAETFSNHRGICPECRRKSKEKVSLLKPYTNNDRINDMSIEEKAEFLENINCSSCAMICSQTPTECDYANLTHQCRVEYCLKNIKQWLESEVTG